MITATNAVGSASPFSPDWGAYGARIWDLADAIESGSVEKDLQEILNSEGVLQTHPDGVKLLFSASLLSDVLKAGGRVWLRDSRIMMTWPDWTGDRGRVAAQAAMRAAREIRPLTISELNRVAPLFTGDIDGEELCTLIRDCRFVLRSIADPHPSGITYSDGFAAALRYWSMPYRGRTGRMKRFVLTAEHEHLPGPVIAGILELGDEAPFCTWRDDLLCLSPASAAAWFKTQSAETLTLAADRLRTIRACIRPTDYEVDVSRAPPEELLRRRVDMEAQARGRSVQSDGGNDQLKQQKRLIYALRLARGESYLRRVEVPTSVRSDDPDFSAGVRALHDLLLPRLHMEVTVCGAVPPFAEALGGKLITSFLSHPLILKAAASGGGELLGWTFDLESLASKLHSKGLICLTTKGLYSGHAAIYNRAVMPGLSRPLRLNHLANTEGTTTSLVSSRTARFARLVLARINPGRSAVSQVYGSGGAKRHRAIEAALAICGLPTSMGNAGIKRPVYGVLFAGNPGEVAWLGREPAMLVDPTADPEAFSNEASQLWREKWLDRAIPRVSDFALAPSLLRSLAESNVEAVA